MTNKTAIKKIAFFSSSPIGERVLLRLMESKFKPIIVVTRPDSKEGRKQIIKENSIALIAKQNSIPVLKPDDLKNHELKNTLSSLDIDIAIVISYGKIIPSEVLSIPKYGFINIHPSLLPKYRGPSPIQTAVLNGDIKTGVTIIKLDDKMDHGPILKQREHIITDSVSLKDLEDELMHIGTELLLEVLDSMPKGQEQQHDEATFTRKFSVDDGILNRHMTAKQAFNVYRALSNEPGCFIKWQNQNLKILDCKIIDISEGGNDSGLFICNKKLYFSCSDGNLEILKLQKPGGRPISNRDFINGNRNLPDLSI